VLYESLATQSPTGRYNEVLKLYPSRFHLWFAKMFPETMSWQEARSCYTRSAAVMSMAGAMIGLGDRHGENILLNNKTGHVVHVDFNAVFSKGETFSVPERVPFRLTRNMVDAMGLSGYEGAFRRVCEITLTVMRENRAMIVSTLETFLHDPLLEFYPKGANAVAKKGSTKLEPVNEFAQDIIRKVTRKLDGKVDASAYATRASHAANAKSDHSVSRAVSLSVEGHVEHLIRQAVDPANLGAMFIGWVMTWMLPCCLLFTHY
jgi:serine/threonine-protein kinase ATR